MGERLYAVQDPFNNVTAILAVQAGGGNGVAVERYIYQPSGLVTVLNGKAVTCSNVGDDESGSGEYQSPSPSVPT